MGFEPTNGGLGSYCLTTWLTPRKAHYNGAESEVKSGVAAVDRERWWRPRRERFPGGRRKNATSSDAQRDRSGRFLQDGIHQEVQVEAETDRPTKAADDPLPPALPEGFRPEGRPTLARRPLLGERGRRRACVPASAVATAIRGPPGRRRDTRQRIFVGAVDRLTQPPADLGFWQGPSSRACSIDEALVAMRMSTGPGWADPPPSGRAWTSRSWICSSPTSPTPTTCSGARAAEPGRRLLLQQGQHRVVEHPDHLQGNPREGDQEGPRPAG